MPAVDTEELHNMVCCQLASLPRELLGERMSEVTGLLFNTQRFSLHDGPGIRTTLFLKGCPLRCYWCANPESWNPFPEVVTRDSRCIRCGCCQEACPTGAITINRRRRVINRSRCNRCLECTLACPARAIEVVGRHTAVGDALREASADTLFYRHSGGGITLSGGEPLLEAKFIREFARECRGHSLHVALDTSGVVSPHVLEEVLPYIDLVLFDIKHMDPKRHKQGTGRSNALILDNARRTAAAVETWLRLPLVPGFNDSPENLALTAKFATESGFTKVSILPYHELWKPKYKQLGWRLPPNLPSPPSEEAVQEAKTFVESFGVKVEVGR